MHKHNGYPTELVIAPRGFWDGEEGGAATGLPPVYTLSRARVRLYPARF
jgi:hypothetical protein